VSSAMQLPRLQLSPRCESVRTLHARAEDTGSHGVVKGARRVGGGFEAKPQERALHSAGCRGAPASPWMSGARADEVALLGLSTSLEGSDERDEVLQIQPPPGRHASRSLPCIADLAK